MPVRKASTRARRLTALAAAVCLVLVAATVTTSAADKEYKGWYTVLDVALTQPLSLDQHFANEIDAANNNIRLVGIDNDSDVTFRGTVGYTFSRGLGSLQASYWGFDNEDRQSGSTNNQLYPAIFGYGYSYGGMYVGYFPSATPISFQATGKVKASTVDLDYLRPIVVNEKFSVKWLAGLRVAHYEEDLGVQEVDANSYTFLQGKHLESHATGLRIGVTGVFGFTKHFNLQASLTSSFLQADTKGDAHQTFVNGGTFNCGAFPCTETREASDDHVRGEIRDYDLRAVWSGYLRNHLDYYLGYSASEWSGMVTDPVEGVSGGLFGIGPVTHRGRDTISFNSLHGGIVWRFGRTRAPGGP